MTVTFRQSDWTVAGAYGHSYLIISLNTRLRNTMLSIGLNQIAVDVLNLAVYRDILAALPSPKGAPA